MKSTSLLGMTAITIMLALTVPPHIVAQSNYEVVELGLLGGTAGSANGINDRGWITGAANTSGDSASMATLAPPYRHRFTLSSREISPNTCVVSLSVAWALLRN